MHASLFLLTAALSLTGPPAHLAGAPARAVNAPGQIMLDRCLVSIVQDGEVDVPAEEPGKLVTMEIREGRDVEAGTLLAKIDDTLPQAQREERQYELAVAKEQAENDVNIRFAQASFRVAEAELTQALEANKKAPGAITQAEIRRLSLTLEKTRLQIEQAEMEQRVNANTAGAKGARLKELEGVVARRAIKAPISGRVVEVLKDNGEWVNPGDTVLKLLRLDLLRVEGFVSANEFASEQIDHKPVTVRVHLANNVVEEFQGKIVYVDSRVQSDGTFRVYAEVLNRRNQADTHWLLRPGSVAQMTVDVRNLAGQPPVDRNAQR
jgi:multidrug efflux pump subunit AcrA (membrane-fusion protein)